MWQKTCPFPPPRQNEHGAGVDRESTENTTSHWPPARGCSGTIAYLILAPGLLLDTNQPCNEGFFEVCLFSEHQFNVWKILSQRSPAHFKDARGEEGCSVGTLRVPGRERNPVGLRKQPPDLGVGPRP